MFARSIGNLNRLEKGFRIRIGFECDMDGLLSIIVFKKVSGTVYNRVGVYLLWLF